MDAYWRETIAARRGQRTDDVVSEIFHAQIGGENLTDDEIYGFCSLILPASQHTTINMMSNTAITLARYPEQRAMLRRDPGLWPDAMEELIRYESPVQGLGRTATRDVELHGVTIPEGAWVLMLFGSANHDERVFENPDVLDITRQGARPHYSFGHGIHYCLGNAVARLQTRVALEELVERARRMGRRRSECRAQSTRSRSGHRAHPDHFRSLRSVMGLHDGKVGIVTGAGSGIGRATAQRLAQRGRAV